MRTIITLFGFISFCLSFASASEPPALRAGHPLGNCARPPASAVDLLNFMLAPLAPSYGGSECVTGPDPDRAGWPTFYCYKFNRRDAFEIYHYNNKGVFLQFEVTKFAGWIRQFDENSLKGTGAGELWSPRFLTPGGHGVLSHFSLDKSQLKGSIWENAPADGITDGQTYLTANWDTADLGGGNQVPTLRISQEWEPAGAIFEDYHYLQGGGIVFWQWNQRLDDLMRRPAAGANRYYGTWDVGSSRVIELDLLKYPPTATAIDLKTNTRTRLPVRKWISYWRKTPAWYVGTRNSTISGPVTVGPRFAVDPVTDIAIDDSGATLSDLPRVNTSLAMSPVSTAVLPPTATLTPANCKFGSCVYLNKLYSNFLDVTADDCGFQFWLDQMHGGAYGCAQTAIPFINDERFLKRARQMDAKQFMTAVYGALLHRSPEKSAIRNAAQVFVADPSAARSKIIKMIFTSSEFKSKCRSEFDFENGAGTFSGLAEF